jgi:hypothetical protein
MTPWMFQKWINERSGWSRLGGEHKQQSEQCSDWWQRGQRKKGQHHYCRHVVGDMVWLEGTNLKLTHPKAKLDAKRYGLFPITKEISPVVFQLTLPPQWHIHNVFHTSLLTPYKETEEYGDNFMQPPLELIDRQEEYKVEQIVNLRHTGCAKKLQYLLC